LRADGAFLLAVGAAQLVFELLGHLASVGPLAAAYSGNGAPLTTGFLEAHALAALFGVLLLDAGTAAHDTHWHGTAAAIHALLAGANLLFWPSFIALGLVPMGVVATTVHLGFVVVHVTCAGLAWSQTRLQASFQTRFQTQ
jgi:hypothetical protein